jgi:transposase-like protein
MPPPAPSARDKTPRFPGELIRHGGWRSSRCTLSDRDGPERRGERGGTVSPAAVRPWGRKWGQASAKRRRHRRPHPGDQGELDEGGWTSNGQRYSRWRAVAQDETVREMVGQRRRPTPAAQQVCRTLLTGLPAGPRGRLTAPRQRDGAAPRARLPGVAHRPRRSRQNRWEPAPRPPRQRERRLPGGTSAGPAPRCVAASGPMAHPGRPRGPLWSAPESRHERRQRGERGAAMTGTERAAARAGRPGERHPLA